MKLMRDPVYQQLHNLLRSVINSASYAIGDQFLTERQIAKDYEVSRATANKVLASLTSEGLLEFRKGVGSFVRGEPAEKNLMLLVSFSENVRASGMVPSSRVLSFRKVDAGEVPPLVAKSLLVEKGDSLYEIRRVRLADEVPLIIEHRFVVGNYCPGLKESDLEGSFFEVLSTKFMMTINRTDETIQPAVILPEEAALLSVDAGRAGFLVTTIGFREGGEPVWHEQALHHPDGFEFRCKVRPAKSTREMRLQLMLSASNREGEKEGDT